jgi:hypothetical protein
VHVAGRREASAVSGVNEAVIAQVVAGVSDEHVEYH